MTWKFEKLSASGLEAMLNLTALSLKALREAPRTPHVISLTTILELVTIVGRTALRLKRSHLRILPRGE